VQTGTNDVQLAGLVCCLRATSGRSLTWLLHQNTDRLRDDFERREEALLDDVAKVGVSFLE